MMKRLILLFAVFYLSCVFGPCLADDTPQPRMDSYELWLRDIQIRLPEAYVVDLRYSSTDSKEGSRIIFRQVIDGSETGSTIAIALLPIDQSSLDGLREAGYTHSKYCGFDIFSRSDKIIQGSKIIIVEQGFIQLTNLQDSHIDGIMQSLCNKPSAVD